MVIFKERIYKFEKSTNFTPVDTHPLLKVSNYKPNSSNQSTVIKQSIIDPLSSNNPLESIADPLSNSTFDRIDYKQESSLNVEPWSSKRITILATFTTSEKLSIISSFLVQKPDESVRVLNKPTSIIDKVKIRLEQLDQFDEEIRETTNLNVQQFTEKITELQSALKLSWKDGQRVKSLQIIIQSTKLLSDSNVVQFFPSKFVLITDLVDNFGTCVFERLKSKSAHSQRGSKVLIPLPDNFKESQVPEIAKETARNWFYKVASIRELVARLYIEAALLPCYKFFDGKLIVESLMRLMKMARGIGNPLLATYARAYVARVGISLYPSLKGYLQVAFDDIVTSLARLTEPEDGSGRRESLEKHAPLLKLFVPAVDWILQCLSCGSPDVDIDAIVAQIERAQNPLLVHAVLNAVSTSYIEKRPLYFAQLIEALPADSGYSRHLMYKQLGACVSLSCSLGPQKALELMKTVWKSIVKLTEPRCFIECADAWAEFLARNFDSTHIGRFLGHICKEMSARDDLCLQFSNQLVSILNKILSYECDFESLLSSSEFMQYLAMFDREPVIIEVRQMVLDSFFNSKISESLSDPVLIQTCIRMLKEMNDSLNSLSIADNKRILTRLILTLIDRIKFEGRNVEQELDLLTQFRSTFGNIEKVIFNIVERVNSLAMRVRSLRPNRDHNSGSASFVRACMAFSYITIPSIEDLSLVIKLYTSTAQVALVNGCLGQAEACIKEAVYLISKLDNDTKVSDKIIDPSSVAEMAASLASTLLMCPDISSVLVADNPSQNQQILYLLKGLINAINICPILKTDQIVTLKSMIKGELYIKIILLLGAFSQPRYLYYAGKTDANDKIYGGSDNFIAVIYEMFKIVVTKIRSLNSPQVNKLLKEALIPITKLDFDVQDSANKDWLIENEI